MRFHLPLLALALAPPAFADPPTHHVVPVRWEHGATLPPEADASTSALLASGAVSMGCNNTSNGVVCWWAVPSSVALPPGVLPDPAVPLIPIEQPGGGQ